MKKIILATTSRVRKLGFEQLGILFTAEDSNVDEYAGKRPEKPEELTLFLAKKKAEAIAKHHKDGIVIGFDSVGYFKGEILEKPRTREEAFERLRRLSEKTHKYITGTYMIEIENKKVISKVTSVDVYFRKITDEEINKYLDQEGGESYKISMGYSPNFFYSASFIKRIDGRITDMIYAIPLDDIIFMLREMGYKC